MAVIDAETLTPGQTLSCDICIIGGGAAGITVAHRLLKTGKKIILLESSAVDQRQNGADEQREIVQQRESTSAPESQAKLAAAGNPDGHRFLDPVTQRLYAGEQKQGLGRDYRFLERSRIRVYGGTTNCWGGWTRSLSPIDFKRTDLLDENLVWPIDAEEMEPHYRSAIRYCSLGDVAPSDYDNPQAWIGRTETPIAYAPQKTGAVRTGVFTVMNGDTTGDHYDGALDFQLMWGKDFVQPTNITVVRNANARYLESSAGRVTIAHAQTIRRPVGKPPEAGLTFRVSAKAYVVAAGGIETVRLLFLSKPGGLGNGAGHLGQNFMIHPLNENAGWVKLNEFPDRDKIRNLYTGWPKIKSNSIYAPRIFAAFVPTDAAMKGAIGNYRMLVNFDSGGMNLNWEQTPNRESQITLGTKQDPIFKDPEVKLDFQMTKIEERTAHAAINAVVDELIALGYASDGSREPPQMDWPGDHHMGATRMSAAKKYGYVDPNCKSWEIDNLYIASPSVFSTGGVSNPTLTIIALASRLADHLARL